MLNGNISSVFEIISSKYLLASNQFIVMPVQFATEAAITILRIDDMIKLFKENDGEE